VGGEHDGAVGGLLSALGDQHFALVHMQCKMSWVKLCLGLLEDAEAPMTASHTSSFAAAAY
jgi:hypothetical protein